MRLSQTEMTCSHPGCISIREAGGGLCAQHRLLWRRGMGLCPNCGGHRERHPVINEITGAQQRRGPERLPVWRMRCTDCGREQRPYAGQT